VVVGDSVLFGRDHGADDNGMVATAHSVFPELELTAASLATEVTPRSRPLVARHRLITLEGGLLTATDRKSGRPLWRARLEAPTASPTFDRGHTAGDAAFVAEPLVYAADSVLVAQGKEVVRIHADTGELVARYALGEHVMAWQPIVHDGWIYAGTTKGAVVAVDTGAPELGGWEMLGGSPDRRGTRDPEG
jgi:outer membrane protein assembly factor BamB